MSFNSTAKFTAPCLLFLFISLGQFSVFKFLLSLTELLPSFLLVVVGERTTKIIPPSTEECAKQYTDGTWKSVVQVRQRVDHKRTFYYLEQLLLKNGSHSRALSIQSFKDGMDFFFAEKNEVSDACFSNCYYYSLVHTVDSLATVLNPCCCELLFFSKGPKYLASSHFSSSFCE